MCDQMPLAEPGTVYPLQVQPHYWPRCRRVPGLFKII